MTGSIGLVAAMSQESQALLRRVQAWKRITLGHLPAYSFSAGGHACLLVTSGMGRRRAADATHILVENAHPQAIISFGIAGAVEADLEIGDVVIPNSCYTWDGATFGECIPLAQWSQAAVEAAAQALSPAGRRVFEGAAVTSGGSQVGQEQLGNLLHPVLEMETAGIAQVAAEYAIPLYSLRAVSDGPRAPIPLDLGEIMDEDSNLRPGRMLRAVISHPRMVLQARRVLHNTDVAARCAANAITAILNLPGLFN